MTIIQEVPTADLIAAISGSVDNRHIYSTWTENLADLISWKFEDSSYQMTDYLAEGQKDPISVLVDGCDEYTFEGWGIGNGNHRLAMNFMLGIPMTLVAFTESREDYMQCATTEYPSNKWWNEA